MNSDTILGHTESFVQWMHLDRANMHHRTNCNTHLIVLRTNSQPKGWIHMMDGWIGLHTAVSMLISVTYDAKLFSYTNSASQRAYLDVIFSSQSFKSIKLEVVEGVFFYHTWRCVGLQVVGAMVIRVVTKIIELNAKFVPCSLHTWCICAECILIDELRTKMNQCTFDCCCRCQVYLFRTFFQYLKDNIYSIQSIRWNSRNTTNWCRSIWKKREFVFDVHFRCKIRNTKLW